LYCNKHQTNKSPLRVLQHVLV